MHEIDMEVGIIILLELFCVHQIITEFFLRVNREIVEKLQEFSFSLLKVIKVYFWFLSFSLFFFLFFLLALTGN
jgi:hypothetical protein